MTILKQVFDVAKVWREEQEKRQIIRNACDEAQADMCSCEKQDGRLYLER
jgi:hypothetical protein